MREGADKTRHGQYDKAGANVVRDPFIPGSTEISKRSLWAWREQEAGRKEERVIWVRYELAFEKKDFWNLHDTEKEYVGEKIRENTHQVLQTHSFII